MICERNYVLDFLVMYASSNTTFIRRKLVNKDVFVHVWALLQIDQERKKLVDGVAMLKSVIGIRDGTRIEPRGGPMNCQISWRGPYS